MKLLNGLELVEYISERQAKQLRTLRQSYNLVPKLVILHTNRTEEFNNFIKLCKKQADDILIEIETINVSQDMTLDTISKLNADATINGIYVYYPIGQNTDTTEVFNAIDIRKEVSGLAENSNFDATVPLSIDWLLAGYNIDLKGKNIVIVGQDNSICFPLFKRWQDSGLLVQVTNNNAQNFTELISNADVLVTASNVPDFIKPAMIKPNIVIIDVGLNTDQYGHVGDISQAVRQLPEIKITPETDGLWPLAVCALFDNVIRAAQKYSKAIS